MKKYIVAYACLLALNIYTAEEKQQQITIQNKNLNQIGIDIFYNDLKTGKDRGFHLGGAENDIPYNEKKTFDIINKEEQFKRSFTLCLPNTVIPEYVTLNITEDGNIRPGDVITVKTKYGDVRIKNTRSAATLLCKSCIKPIMIGFDPANFPNSIATKQQIHVINTDLFQVSVVIESLRKSFSKPKNHMLSNSYVSNEIAESTTVTLEKGCMRCFKITPSVDENIRKRLMLIIPEAKQEVLVNINEGEINSGSILQVCWSADKQKIEIKKLFPNSNAFTLLACLYSRKVENLTEIFG